MKHHVVSRSADKTFPASLRLGRESIRVPVVGHWPLRFARIRADGGAGIPNQRRDCESGPCRRCWHRRPATAALRWLGHRRAVAACSPHFGRAAPRRRRNSAGPPASPRFASTRSMACQRAPEAARRVSKKSRRVGAAAKQHAPGDRPLAILAWVTLLLGTRVSSPGWP